MHIKTSDQEKLILGIGSYTCNWGVHICGLYETNTERDDIIFGFLCEGLKTNDLQLYCPSERTNEEFYHDFENLCPDCRDKCHDHNHLTLLSASELYYPQGVFDPWHMDESLNQFFVQSQKDGKRNIRATAEMSWALQVIPGVEHLMAYEARLNYFIPGKPWISFCLYNLNKFNGTTIMNVLRTHPYTISNGTIMQNPYFINPNKWLAENAPQFLTKTF